MSSGMFVPKQPQTGPVQPPLVYVKEDSAWEYKRLTRHMGETGAPTEEELSELGAEGWELSGILKHAHYVYLYFKRRAK